MSITSTWCVSPRISPSLQSLPPSPSLYWTMHNWHHSTALSPCWPPLKPNPRPKTQWQAVLSRGVIFSGVSGGDRVSMVDGICAGVFAVLVILSMDSISRVVRGLLRATNWIMKSWGRKQIWRNHMSSGAKQFPRIQKLFQIEILLSVSAQRSMVVFPQHVEWDVIALRFSKTSRAWSQKHPLMASNLWDDLLGWRWSWAGLVQPGSPGSDTAATLLGNERSGNSNGENQGKPWDLRSILLSNNPISVFPWSFQSVKKFGLYSSTLHLDQNQIAGNIWKLIYQTEGSISISHSENPANFHHERPMSRVQWTGEAKTGCSNINEAAEGTMSSFSANPIHVFLTGGWLTWPILEGQNPRYRMV